MLTVEGISAGYGGGLIVKNVSLSVSAGEIAVLLGPNGAGKSTLLKAIVGLIPRTEGRVLLQGADISRWPTETVIQKGLSYVPQVGNVFPSLTIMENLEMGGFFMRSGVKKRVTELLDLFPNLRKASRRAAGTLSGGERNLLALARGFMPKPSVLLVDEPTAGLSPHYEEVVWKQINLIRRTGVAVLVVEQNVIQALKNADTAYVLVLGETRLRAPAPELLGSDELTSLFLGGERTQTAHGIRGRE